MDSTKKIKLFTNRDFSDNFDLSLTFIKQNYGAVIKGLLILIPLVLIIQFLMPATPQVPSNMNNMEDVLAFYAEIFTPARIGLSLISWLVSLALMLYVISYMALYSKSADGEVKIGDVWNKVMKVFLPILLATILFCIAFSVGLMLCLIPGIILFVYCGFFPYVYLNEEKGIFSSFQRSFDLVKDNWWVTFGFGFVFLILLTIGYIIFSIPAFIAGFGMAIGFDFFGSSTFTYIAAAIAQTGGILLSPILYMALGVMYYGHRCKADGTDMETDIDQIGTDEENTSNY
ncbi:hypothetical protein [Dysgonomonas sp. 511]|uniref:hypothetical protein n=1 Tax=Dysgonomonas sp. 511 TaxID=2302930 RepID=UPI0013D1E330|nr:hypothetical protein [Dysgonomonas sp. 511]NDV77937.1 hypothetical protein [Dysgonomonas sp. 511]